MNEASVTKPRVISEDRTEHRNGGDGEGVAGGAYFKLEAFVTADKSVLMGR